MGDNWHNYEHRVHVGEGALDGEHFYGHHYGAGGIDERSPGMPLTGGGLAAILSSAGQGEPAWLAAMPTPVATWLNARPSAVRAGLRDVDVRMASQV